MPLPTPNLHQPFNIVRLSHVELAVTDLAKSRAFYVDVLGLQVTDETTDTIYLRAMEERGHHCIVLKKAATAPISRAPSAPAIPKASRSNFIRRWTACRRSTRNMRSIAA
ncbi:hypothetical protein BLJAPNOD_01526 [Ensifer sp. M14]|nr:hypothetical protein BLJAPNOD_01526 [Ensifer sp. M14]